jgi:hypothetical protein
MQSMNIKYLLPALAISASVITLSCEKDKNKEKPAEKETNVIIDQETVYQTVELGSAAGFVILAGSQVSNMPSSAISGNIGLSPAAGSRITGFSSTEIAGTIYTVDGSGPESSVPYEIGLTSAKGDLTTAYNDAAGRTATDIVLLAGNIGGLTLTPGLYKSKVSLEISSGNLTFDAKGDSAAVFIIQADSSLITACGSKVILSGRASAANIFWQVGSSASLGTTSVFKGIIMADQSVSLNTGATVEGRIFARVGAVTLDSNIVVAPE